MAPFPVNAAAQPRRNDMTRFPFKSPLANAVVVCVFGGAVFAAGYQLGQRSREPEIAFLHEHAAAWEKMVDYRDLLHKIENAHDRAMPIAEFEKQIGPLRAGVPADLPKRHQDKTHIFTDNETGCVFELRFDDGKLAAFHGGYGLGEAHRQVRESTTESPSGAILVVD